MSERLRAMLNYDAATGLFTWRAKPNRCIPVGSVAGSRTKGYVDLELDGKHYKAHRAAWFFVHGEWPQGEIDHINGVRDDNRIANLRLATPSQQRQNKVPAKNLTGFPGVHRHKNRFGARIQVDGKQKFLGIYQTAEEAGRVYLEAKRRLHPFAREELSCIRD